MIAGRPGRIAFHLPLQLSLLNQVVHDVLCRRRSADVAQANKQDLGHHDSISI
jgi:hypothetical protein